MITLMEMNERNRARVLLLVAMRTYNQLRPTTSEAGQHRFYSETADLFGALLDNFNTYGDLTREDLENKLSTLIQTEYNGGCRYRGVFISFLQRIARHNWWENEVVDVTSVSGEI